MFHVICGNPHLNQKFEKFKFEKSQVPMSPGSNDTK